MFSLEGFQTFYRSRGGDAPTASRAPSMDASVYQTRRLAPGVSFDTYKRATPVPTPRGDYDTSPAAPTAVSASEYLRKKYGDFSGATAIAPPLPPAPAQTQILGTDALTVGDLKLLQTSVDLELLRLQNLRSTSALITIKQSQLDSLSTNLADVLGRVERGEIKVEQVSIFPATARQFLKTFRTSENLPELFDMNGNSPASVAALAPAPAPAASTPSTSSPSTAPTVATSPASNKSFLQWLYENIQALKWSLEANYRVEEAKQRQMSDSLQEMEKRILGYSYGDTPMPEGYQKLFLERIRGLQKELNEVPDRD